MKTVKVIAFCLALLLVFYAVPLNVYAELGSKEEFEEQSNTYEASDYELPVCVL